MDEILSQIENAKSSPDNPNISNILIRLQDEVNWQFLERYSQSDKENFLSNFWSFIFEVGSNPNTSIRISAYRTTLTLLLKITPYYPSLIQKTFFASYKMIEIDSKNVQIVIAAFSFISNFTPIQFLNHILENFDILQNFTLIDSTFADHIGPIIKNLRRLNKEWLNKLLFIFLEKGIKPQDRHLILAVTEIIKHEPIFFINQLLTYLRKQSKVKENFSIISYLFSNIKCNYKTIDLKDIVEFSMEILLNSQQSTANDIDSALQILSLEMAPFEITISLNDSNESESSKYNSEKNNQKLFIQINSDSYKYEFTINASDFINRPSFFLLPLPINLLEISSNDGVLQLTSKFKTMAKIVNKKETCFKDKHYIFEKFASVLSKSYNDTTSACLQGFSLCLPTFLEMLDTTDVYILSKHVIFGPQQSWFHMNDILNIIKSIPYKCYDFYASRSIQKVSYYRFDAKKIIDMLINFSMNSNEKLSKEAEKTIANIINYTNFTQGTYYISRKTDFFDLTSLHHYLSIFAAILKRKRKIRKSEKTTRNYNKNEGRHLHYYMLRIIEAVSIYEDDIHTFLQAINILSYFDLHFVEKTILRDFAFFAQAIIEASLLVVGGLKIEDDQISPEKMNIIYNYVSEEYESLNFESIPEMKIDYCNFLPAFSTSFRFLSILPRYFILKKRGLAINLFSWCMNIFPHPSAKFAERFWESYLNPNSNVDFLTTVLPTLEFIQDDPTIAMYCRLYLSVDNKNEQLDTFSAVLHIITRDEIEANRFYPEFYAFEIYNSKEKGDGNPMKSKISQLSRERQINLYHFLINYEDKLKLIDKIGESTFNKIPSEIQIIKDQHEQKKKQQLQQPSQLQRQVIIQNQQNKDQRLQRQKKKRETQSVTVDPQQTKNLNDSQNMQKRPRRRVEQNLPQQDDMQAKTRIRTRTSVQPNMTAESLNEGRSSSRVHRSNSVEIVKISKETQPKVAKSEDENDFEEENESTFAYSSFINENDEESSNNNKSQLLNEILEEDEHSEDAENPIFCEEKIVTENILESNIIDKQLLNPLIKTQLRMGTFDFSKEQLMKLLSHYVNIDDSSGIESVLKYASEKKIDLSLVNYILPTDCTAAVLKYLKSVSSSELTAFIEKCKNSPQTAEVKYALFSLDPKKNFNDLLNSPHLTKQELKEFSISFDLCNHRDLVGFIIRHLKEAKSTKRLDIVLALANVIFSYGTLTKSEVETIIEIVNAKDKLIPCYSLAQLILTVALKIEPNEEFAKFVKNCYNKCTGRSSGILQLHQALIASSTSKATENLTNLSQPYLVSPIPSVFCCGVRFVIQALTSLSESDCVPLLKANLGKLLKNFLKKRDLYPIAKVTGVPLTFMLTKDTLRAFQTELLNRSLDILPSNDKASFEGLSLCLPRFISCYTDGPIETLRALEIKCDELLTKPANLQTFEVYMMCLKERVERALCTCTNDDVVSDFITQWLQQCKDFDCYNMAEVIYEWENFIFKSYGLEQVLNYVCYMFLKYTPRFFSLYVGLTKFLRKQLRNATENDKELIERHLLNSALINQVRAHALSTLLILENKYSKEALQLASYPEDCEESNRLIDSNNDFVELLNKIKTNV